jgi:hypothetical protein
LSAARVPLCWSVPQETDAEKIARLERKLQELTAENDRLRRTLEEALRTAKRQAAPGYQDSTMTCSNVVLSPLSVYVI